MADTPEQQVTPQLATQDAVRAEQSLGKQGQLLAPVPDWAVPVRTPAGEIGYITNDELPAAKAAGYAVASIDELRHQQVKEQYGDTASRLAAGAYGMVDMLPLGAGRGLMYKGAETILGSRKAAEEWMQPLEDTREANPDEFMIGQGVGLFMPGVGTEGIAAHAFQGATGVAATAGKWALTGALDASIYGAGNAYSDAMLGDPTHVAELVLASVPKNFLLGAGLGGAVGLTGALIGKVGRGIAKKLPSADALGSQLMADSLGIEERLQKELTNANYDAHRLGSWMQKEPEIASWALHGGRVDREFAGTLGKIYDRSTAEMESVIERVNGLAEKEGKMVDAAPIFQRYEEELLKPLEAEPFHAAAAKKMQERLDDLGVKIGYYQKVDGEIVRDIVSNKAVPGAAKVDFKQMHALKEDFFKYLKSEGKLSATNRVAEDLRKAHAIMEEEFIKQLPNAEEYQAAVDKTRLSGFAEEAATAKVRKPGSFGLGSVGAAMGLGFLGPKGLAFGLLSKAARERGAQFTAAVLHKAQGMAAIKGATNAITDRIANASRTMVRGTIKASSLTSDRSAEADKKAEHIKQLAVSPDRIRAMIEHHIDPDVAPNVQEAYIKRTIQSLQYLAQTAPQGAQLMPMLPGAATTKPNKAAKTSWLRALDVFVDPVGSIESATKRGQLTMDHVRAVNAFYPQLANEMRQQTVAALAELATHGGKMPTYGKRMQLGLLLGAPTDYTLQASFVIAQQHIVESPADEQSYDNSGQGNVAPRSQARREKANGGEQAMDDEDS